MYTIKAQRGHAHYVCSGLKECLLCSYDSHSGNFSPAWGNTPKAYQCSDTVNQTHAHWSTSNHPAILICVNMSLNDYEIK